MFGARASRAALRSTVPVEAFPRGGAPRYHAGVTTTLSPRDKAAQDAAALVSYLRTRASRCRWSTELTDLGEHLERAILAFHMEAIRFRAFTMSRLIKQHHARLPADVPPAWTTILHDLEAAGFQTRRSRRSAVRMRDADAGMSSRQASTCRISASALPREARQGRGGGYRWW